jgi:hypothetical protein
MLLDLVSSRQQAGSSKAGTACFLLLACTHEFWQAAGDSETAVAGFSLDQRCHSSHMPGRRHAVLYSYEC